jgi:translation elongation factor EF-4
VVVTWGTNAFCVLTLLPAPQVIDRQQVVPPECRILLQCCYALQFEVVIQASLHGKPFARERIAPFRKDVLTTKAGKTVSTN